MAAIHVILADDHAVVRKGIREFLQEEEDILVLAEASDGIAAKALIQEHLPDVAILDIRMPGATGIDITRWVRSQELPVRVLIVTAFDDGPFVTAALRAGANGYVMKDADAEQIIAAVRSVHHGQTALDPAVTRFLVAPPSNQAAGTGVLEGLSERERAVLELAARGLTNRGIGAELTISDRTVQGHLANIYAKLQVNTRTEAVTKAIQLGLFQLPASQN
jgi:DNA-binding NarL/FixJ family response regulator